MDPLPKRIEELSAALSKAEAVADQVRGCLVPFFRGGYFVARPWHAPEGEMPKEGNPTAAAFVTYLLLKAGALRSALEGSKDSTSGHASSLNEVIFLLEKSSSDENGKLEATDTQQLPNTYNTPILVAGLLASCRASVAGLDQTRAVASAKGSLQYILRTVQKNQGFLEALSSGDYAEAKGPNPAPLLPSAVSTFWAAAALQEAMALSNSPEERDQIHSALEQIGRWAQRVVAEMQAWHFSEVPNRLDPVDAVCAAALTYQCNGGPDVVKLADKLVSVIFESYFQNGQLGKSRPVFADKQNNRSISCSTYETICYLYCAIEQRQETAAPVKASWQHAAAAAARASAAWIDGKGVPNDQDARHGSVSVPTAFSTAAGAALVSFAVGAIEDELDVASKAELGVSPYKNRSSKEQAYPEHLEKVIQSFILGKVDSADAEAREQAFYSMIWFGPPGTGKTSFAKRLAAELKWSFLQVTQKDFLRYGSDLIDASAEQIFRLLLNLKRTVVLFDELEELVQAREEKRKDIARDTAKQVDPETRRLTTSMLPRIHDLRDREQVVFIFATNRLSSFDPAATRLGRFDAIVGLPPPNKAQRASIFDNLVDKRLGRFGQDRVKEIKEQALKAAFPDEFRGMIYKDIEFVVKQVNSRLDDGEKISSESLEKLFNENRSIDEDTLSTFKRLASEDARPRYKVAVD